MTVCLICFSERIIIPIWGREGQGWQYTEKTGLTVPSTILKMRRSVRNLTKT